MEATARAEAGPARRSKRALRRRGRLHVSGAGAVVGADLGGSSKYTSASLEGRSGEGFHVNRSGP
jgi:hypothetical protein